MNNMILTLLWIFCEKNPLGICRDSDWNFVLAVREMSGESQRFFFLPNLWYPWQSKDMDMQYVYFLYIVFKYQFRDREFGTRYTKCIVCLNNASIITIISDWYVCEWVNLNSLVAVMFWLTHWSYAFLALTHRYIISNPTAWNTNCLYGSWFVFTSTQWGMSSGGHCWNYHPGDHFQFIN